MSKKTIAILIIIATVILVLLFIYLRINKDLNEPKETANDDTATEVNVESEDDSYKDIIIDPTFETPTAKITPTYYGKPSIESTEKTEPATEQYTKHILQEKVEISINGINVEQLKYLSDFYETGYGLDKNMKKGQLEYNEVNNPYLINSHDKTDQVMLAIKNTETVSSPYSECLIKNIMCDFSKCKAKITVGQYDATSLTPKLLISNYGTPTSYTEEENDCYISYQAQNLTFDFEFSNDKLISLGINL